MQVLRRVGAAAQQLVAEQAAIGVYQGLDVRLNQALVQHFQEGGALHREGCHKWLLADFGFRAEGVGRGAAACLAAPQAEFVVGEVEDVPGANGCRGFDAPVVDPGTVGAAQVLQPEAAVAAVEAGVQTGKARYRQGNAAVLAAPQGQWECLQVNAPRQVRLAIR